MSARLEPPHTVGGAIARRARRAPARPALIGADGASLSYAALAGAISAARWQLQDAGLRREDRIGTILPPGVAGARLLVSLACNICVVPIDPALEADAIDAVVDATGIKALARATPEGMLRLEHLAPPRERAALRPTRGVDVALLLRPDESRSPRALYPLTHRDLRDVAARMQRALELGANHSVGCRVPLHGAGIEVWLFAPLILGASVALGAAGDLAPQQQLAAEALQHAPPLRGEPHEAAAVAAAHVQSSELPPALIIGSGIPLVGAIASTTVIFMKAWNTIMVVTPSARYLPKSSSARTLARNPRHKMSPNAVSTPNDPSSPHSSQITA